MKFKFLQFLEVTLGRLVLAGATGDQREEIYVHKTYNLNLLNDILENSRIRISEIFERIQIREAQN
jgi:hypothetical protein